MERSEKQIELLAFNVKITKAFINYDIYIGSNVFFKVQIISTDYNPHYLQLVINANS